jgi:hypothetical protein
LKKMVKKRFGVGNPPLGWYFVPNALGGLGLHNSLIEPLALRENLEKDPWARMQKVLESEPDGFRRAKETYTEAPIGGATGSSSTRRIPWNMSLEEYISGRENASSTWESEYRHLLEYVEPHEIASTSDVDAAIAVLPESSNGTFSKYTDYDLLSSYDQWILTLYCAELTSTFGSFAIVDPALIPIGMLEVFRDTKVRWEQ